MADYDYTEADLIAIRSAIKQGVKRVEYKDKVVEYQSLKDMLAVEGRILAGLGLLVSRPGRLYASVSKGTKW